MKEIGVILITDPSCGSCGNLREIWQDLSGKYSNVKFITIDASIREEVLYTYNLTNIPSIVFVTPEAEALEVIDGADWVTRGTITDKLQQRGFTQLVGDFAVSVNKIRQTWQWFVIGLLVVALGVFIFKKVR